MKKELEEKLVKRFPNLYGDYNNKNPRETLMCFGFEHGDGWYELIYDLSMELEPLIEKYIEENPDEEYYPRAMQVKEKYGGLRFYMSSATDEMYDIIENYEMLSERTCEICGNPGEIRPGGWITTLCDECYEKDV